jgi:hypothetical protein
MHETTRPMIRFYILCAVWLATSSGMTFAALGPVDVVLMNVIDTGAVLRATTALALGLLTGSLVTWMLWASFPVQRTRLVTADQRDPARGRVVGTTLRS